MYWKGLWFNVGKLCSPWRSKSHMQTKESKAKPSHEKKKEEGGGGIKENISFQWTEVPN